MRVLLLCLYIILPLARAMDFTKIMDPECDTKLASLNSARAGKLYDRTKMLPRYVGEEYGNSEEQRLAREAHALTSGRDRFDGSEAKSIDVDYIAKENLDKFIFQVDRDWIIERFGLGKVRLVAVMDGQGQIYADRPNATLKHSSFLRGQPVAFAGNITIENGRIVAIDYHSGHYMPKPWFIKQFIDELHSRSVDTSAIRVVLYDYGMFGPSECKFPQPFANQIQNLIARSDSSFKDFMPRAVELTLAREVALKTGAILLKDYGVLAPGRIGAEVLLDLVEELSRKRYVRGDSISNVNDLERYVRANALRLGEEVQRKLLLSASEIVDQHGCNSPIPELKAKCEMIFGILAMRRLGPPLLREVLEVKEKLPYSVDTFWIHNLLDKSISPEIQN